MHMSCLGAYVPDGWELVMPQEVWILMALMRDVCLVTTTSF
jgi:hypothetical protein